MLNEGKRCYPNIESVKKNKNMKYERVQGGQGIFCQRWEDVPGRRRRQLYIFSGDTVQLCFNW